MTTRTEETTRPKVTPEVGYRLAALTDGEGCFCIFPRGTRLPHHEPHWAVLFKVHLRGDDEPFLTKMQEAIGLGRINRGVYHKQKGCPWASWAVQAKLECLELVAIFDEYPLWSKKARDYAYWREAVLYSQAPRKKPNNRFDWSPLRELRDAMQETRKYVAVAA